MLERTGGGLFDRRGKRRASALRDYYAVDSRTLCGTDNSTEIIRILYTVEHKHKRRLAALLGYRKDLIDRDIFLGSSIRDYPLMVEPSADTVKSRSLCMSYRNAARSRLRYDQLGRALEFSLLDHELVNASAGLKQLEHGISARYYSLRQFLGPSASAVRRALSVITVLFGSAVVSLFIAKFHICLCLGFLIHITCPL